MKTLSPVVFGPAADVSLYRSDVSTLKTDGAGVVLERLAVGSNGRVFGSGEYISKLSVEGTMTTDGPAEGLAVAATLSPGDDMPAYMSVTTGTIASTAAETITTAASMLASTLTKTGTGTITESHAIIAIPSTIGTTNYGISVWAAATATLWISANADSTTAPGGITFGLSRDTNLYRSAANTLRTDDSLVIGGTLSFGTPSTGWAVTAGYTPLTSFDPTGVTAAELARVVGTLVDALKTHGMLGA